MLLDQLIEEANKNFKDDTALVFGETSITYHQLSDKISILSNHILKNAANELFIGVTTTRSIEMIVGVLAILKAGKAYLPLDPNYPAARLNDLITNSEIRYSVCFGEEKRLFNSLGLDTIDITENSKIPDLPVLFNNPVACVLYTSGSTGKPKGVCLCHSGLINLLRCQIENGIAQPGVRTLQFCHLSFDAAFIEIFLPLITGGTLYIIDDNVRYNSSSLLNFIEDNRINRLFLSYTIIQFLAETAQIRQRYPLMLKEIITGGELLKITPQIRDFFHHLPDCVFMNVYGPTETSVWVTELKLKGDAMTWPAIPSIGKSIAGTGVVLVDENLDAVDFRKTGEILIFGDCVALNYLNRPDETEKRFLKWRHPELGEIKVYRTGDLAYFNADGTLQFNGRMDQQVKIRGGYRIELGEIEGIISKISGISQVAVVAREDISDQKKIVAYVICSSQRLTEKQIKKEVGSQLPGYMVPDMIVFLQTFPYTVSGKIDRAALPVPESAAAEHVSGFKAPRTTLEEYLKTLWEDLLQLKDISINDDFFDLGGNSILTIQMMVQIERETGKNLPLVSVYNHPTIEKMGDLIIKQEPYEEMSPLVAIKPGGSRSPVYLIHGDNLNVLNFAAMAKYVSPEQPIYGLQARGLDGISEPFNDIPAMAKYYIEAILQQNPDGPYAIAGYSFGAYVGLEMAKQLKEMGKTISMLAFLDTQFILDRTRLGLFKKISRKIARQGPKFLWIAKSLRRAPGEALDYQFTRLKVTLRKSLNMIVFPVSPGTEKYYLLMDKINQKHHQGLYNYHVDQYQGKLVLFNATDHIYFIQDSEYMGWRNLASEGIDVYKVPGDHVTMFKEPNCRILAQKLEKALAKAWLV